MVIKILKLQLFIDQHTRKDRLLRGQGVQARSLFEWRSFGFACLCSLLFLVSRLGSLLKRLRYSRVWGLLFGRLFHGGLLRTVFAHFHRCRCIRIIFSWGLRLQLLFLSRIWSSYLQFLPECLGLPTLIFSSFYRLPHSFLLFVSIFFLLCLFSSQFIQILLLLIYFFQVLSWALAILLQ